MARSRRGSASSERTRSFCPGPVSRKKAGISASRERPFIEIVASQADALDLHRPVPVLCRGDSAAIRAEADQRRVLAKPGARELTDIMLAPDLAHLGELRGDMRVVGPHHGF